MEYRSIRLLFSACAVATVAALAASHVGGAAGEATTRFTGTLRLPSGAGAVSLSLELGARSGIASLGAGHAFRAPVSVRRAGGTVTVVLPGRPSVTLTGSVRGAVFAGRTRQGTASGTFTTRRAAEPAAWASLGLYRRADGGVIAVVPLGPGRYGLEFAADGVRRLYPAGPGTWELGHGVGVRAPVAGRATFTADAVNWAGAPARRVPVTQLEVRFPSRGLWLAGTLSIPDGPGPHPAVALVHGSGPTTRDDVGFYGSYLLSRGLAVLAYDKRGIGQSGGRYPGEAASEQAIDAYARDAEAAARFLAAQPEVDRRRVGLAGVSQAGWIMPRAAVREPTIRFLVLPVGPATTQAETDYWGSLTSHGDAATVDLKGFESTVRDLGPSGVNPIPWIRKLSIPALWLYGALDMHVPTTLSVERLTPITREPGRDLTLVVFPRANHGMITSRTGLNREAIGSSRFADGLFATIGRWLDKRGLAGAGA